MEPKFKRSRCYADMEHSEQSNLNTSSNELIINSDQDTTNGNNAKQLNTNFLLLEEIKRLKKKLNL